MMSEDQHPAEMTEWGYDHASCCDACGGTGYQFGGEMCWDCRATGHPHAPLDPPTPAPAESDVEELAKWLHNEGDGGVWESFDWANSVTVARAVLAAGYARLTPPAETERSVVITDEERDQIRHSIRDDDLMPTVNRIVAARVSAALAKAEALVDEWADFEHDAVTCPRFDCGDCTMLNAIHDLRAALADARSVSE